jgi:hypothetical protein
MAGLNNIDEVEVVLTGEIVQVCVDQRKSWASIPMTKKSGLDIIESEIPLYECIIT